MENHLLERILYEKNHKISGGIYHKIQIELTYNSNHIEGSKLSEEETRYIFETKTVGIEGKALPVDDIIETVNHFACVDFLLDKVNEELSEEMIKEFHFILKMGTEDSRDKNFSVGDYKKLPNEVGGRETSLPEDVKKDMKALLENYHSLSKKTFEDLMDFHYRFERIHPFGDGNGRVGRLILFKECLKENIIPFIIEDEIKAYYYRGLKLYEEEKGFLRDTFLSMQDRFKAYLDYFRITYE